MTDERKDQLTAEADGLIEGRNAVIEALRTEASIDKIFIQKGEVDKTLGHIASKARAAASARISSTLTYSRTAARAMTP